MEPYKVLVAGTLERLEDMVSYFMTEGYTPQGGVCVIQTSRHTCLGIQESKFAQAMIYKGMS